MPKRKPGRTAARLRRRRELMIARERDRPATRRRDDHRRTGDRRSRIRDRRQDQRDPSSRVSRSASFHGRIPDWVEGRPPGAGARRPRGVRRRLARPRRAHRGIAARLRAARGDGHRRRRCRRRRRAGRRRWLSKGFRRSEGEGFSPRRRRLKPLAPPGLRRSRRLRRRAAAGVRQAQAVARGDLPLRPARPQGRRPDRPRRSRHRPVRRPQADLGRPTATSSRSSSSCVYHGDAKLFVPVERLDLIQKFTGRLEAAARSPGRHHAGRRPRPRVKKAMRDMAEELLKLYAARKAVPGHAFSADTHWQEEFEDAFEFELTPDQATAIADIKRDMESSDADGPPAVRRRRLRQDRSGDARRVQGGDGRQAGGVAGAHHGAGRAAPQDAARRFAAFPAKIDMVSRFRTKQEIKETLEALAAGRLDVIVGTHRLLSKDVELQGPRPAGRGRRAALRRRAQGTHQADAQEGGRAHDDGHADSAHAQHVARRHPRHVGDRNAAEGPPGDSDQRRQVRFQRDRARDSRRDRARRAGVLRAQPRRVDLLDGQPAPAARARRARGRAATARWRKTRSRSAMLDFMAHEYDVLLATTIVENGLDIPNANTIIINRADRYGLSQLYQLRGRVGRSDRAAYAYLLIPPEESLSPVARKRLAAIKEFSDLGSGFRVAALDLEIRGAGNLLGGEQSGTHRRRRLRDVHEAARRDDPRAEGRGPRRRCARDGQPQGGLPPRRGRTCPT